MIHEAVSQDGCAASSARSTASLPTTSPPTATSTCASRRWSATTRPTARSGRGGRRRQRTCRLPRRGRAALLSSPWTRAASHPAVRDQFGVRRLAAVGRRGLGLRANAVVVVRRPRHGRVEDHGDAPRRLCWKGIKMDCVYRRASFGRLGRRQYTVRTSAWAPRARTRGRGAPVVDVRGMGWTPPAATATAASWTSRTPTGTFHRPGAQGGDRARSHYGWDHTRRRFVANNVVFGRPPPRNFALL